MTVTLTAATPREPMSSHTTRQDSNLTHTTAVSSYTTVPHDTSSGRSASTSTDRVAIAQKTQRHSDRQKYNAIQSKTLAKPKKSVRWATITVHEFGIGLGGSAVSNKGGPSIGLAQVPEFTWTTQVGEMAEGVEGVHRFTPDQRTRLLQVAGIPDGIIKRHARETNIILGSRRRSMVRWEPKEERDEEDQEHSRKRKAEDVRLEYPCAAWTQRPRMIPINYV